MKMDKLIQLQIRDEETERWKDYKKLLAAVNWKSGSEQYSSGRETIANCLVFSVRYQPFLEDVAFNPGIYRVIYRGYSFNIIGHDDYFEEHNVVKLIAESDGAPV